MRTGERAGRSAAGRKPFTASDLAVSRSAPATCRCCHRCREGRSPHFPVRYEDFRAVIGIDPLGLREGSLPPRVLGLVMEWAELHQAELRENWTTLAAEGNFRRIAPLV